MTKIDLSNVTLWTCVWTPDESLIDRSFWTICHCLTFAKFGRVLFFSASDPSIEDNIDVVRIPQLDTQRWNLFVNNEVARHINTPFAMSVHEDGFFINPQLWDNRFLEYDYIGAPWPDGVVGNGGFSISSKRLLDTVASLNQTDGTIPSDVFVCRNNRSALEAAGLRFAPTDLALKFSTEETGHDQPSFGYHGRTANPEKYALGRKLVEESNRPTAEIVYVHVANDPHFGMLAHRFVSSYLANPPLENHKTTVVCNCGEPCQEIRWLFGALPNVKFLIHDNTGYDIGGHQHAARDSDSELMVFFSSSSFFKRAGWLKRMVDSYLKHGPGIYGAMGHMGHAPSMVWPHIRTTGFWMPRELFVQYPVISRAEDRYPAEHGPNSITEWIRKSGLKAVVTTWDAEYEWPDWDKCPNGYHQGDQGQLLTLDRVCEPPFYQA